MLSHVGGYLADYMFTEYRSRAGYPCSCFYVKNWVYHTIYDESGKCTGETTASLLHDMLTGWGHHDKELASGHERLGDVFETTVALCFYKNDWRPIYQLVEFATLHEMKALLSRKHP